MSREPEKTNSGPLHAGWRNHLISIRYIRRRSVHSKITICGLNGG